MANKLKRGITIAELIGIFAMLGVLCIAVTPHLWEFREAKKLSTLRFTLEKLRQRIDDYRHRHGQPPKELGDAFAESKLEQPVGIVQRRADKRADNSSSEFPIEDSCEVFENPMSNAAIGSRNRVKNISVDPPGVEHVTRSGLGGWLYNPTTGGVWADAESFLDE